MASMSSPILFVFLFRTKIYHGLGERSTHPKYTQTIKKVTTEVAIKTALTMLDNSMVVVEV